MRRACERFVGARLCPGNAWRACVVWLGLALVFTQQGCRAQQSWPLWEHYCVHFLDSSGRIVDHTANDRSTSEGQAYGMFFALVANDRASFDKLLRWTGDNLASGNLTAHLPAWLWGKTASGEWKTIDVNSASDADLWLAYDCLEAGRLWKDQRLTNLGRLLAERIAHAEVAQTPGTGAVLLPGPYGFHADPGGYVLNLSYSPPQLLARLRLEQPNGPWAGMAESLPKLLAADAPAGFAMDWMVTDPVARPSASPDQLARKKDAPAVGTFDAIRLYLWLGMADPRTQGVRQGLASLRGMGSYLRGSVLPPLQVEAGGRIVQPDGPVGFSAAVLPYLLANGWEREAAVQRERLAASLQTESGLYGRTVGYYDQNLALFATGWAEQRFRFDQDGRLQLPWRGELPHNLPFHRE